MINTEIERKFIVDPNNFPKYLCTNIIKITQWYISLSPNNIRGRIIEHISPKRLSVIKTEAFLTIKSEYIPGVLSRKELEIPVEEKYARSAMEFAKTIIEKTRYVIPNGKYNWEVDIYPNKKQGIAEIELPTEKSQFNIPDWIGREVTSDNEFWNVFLK